VRFDYDIELTMRRTQTYNVRHCYDRFTTIVRGL